MIGLSPILERSRLAQWREVAGLNSAVSACAVVMWYLRDVQQDSSCFQPHKAEQDSPQEAKISSRTLLVVKTHSYWSAEAATKWTCLDTRSA